MGLRPSEDHQVRRRLRLEPIPKRIEPLGILVVLMNRDVVTVPRHADAALREAVDQVVAEEADAEVDRIMTAPRFGFALNAIVGVISRTTGHSGAGSMRLDHQARDWVRTDGHRPKRGAVARSSCSTSAAIEP
jgi:hypothetical protein